MVNKVIITVHFVDYLVIIIADVVTSFYPITDLRAMEISYIC